MKGRNILTGQRFGRLLVGELQPGSGESRFLCRCDCGAEKVLSLTVLRAGNSRSCGCLRREMTRNMSRKHGLSETKTWRAWCAMRRRCTDPKCPQWPHYGGRGIKVCERWRDFSNFLADMGEAPEGHSLDRIDVNSDYAPGNCRWATQKRQTRNMRRTHWVTFEGETKCLMDWCEERGMSYHRVKDRLRKFKWTVERAFQTP